MKIVVVIDVYDNLTNGTVMTAFRFVEEFRRQGHDVRVVGTGAFGKDSYPVPERYIPIVTEVSAQQQIRFGKPDIDVLTNAFDGADVIHFYLPFKLEKEARKIAKVMDIPATAAFHLQPENITYNVGFKNSKILAKILYSGFKSRFYKYFDHVHCPSQFIADQLKKNNYKCKTHVISNGVAADFVPPKEGYIKDKAEKEFFDIIMIGRYAPEKRQDVLIKAIAKSKYADKIRLTLAGKGPRRSKLEKLGKKYLKNPINFAFFKKEELIEEIHQKDLYVHAADIEIEAIACIEAFSCGLVPVIANSSKSATPQFALDERSLFKPGSSKELAEKIDYWIEHKEEREEMSKKYVEHSKKYSIEYSIKKTEEMFKEAIETHNNKKELKKELNKQKSKDIVDINIGYRFFGKLFYYLFVFPTAYFGSKIGFGLKIKGKKNLRKALKTGAISISNHVHLNDTAFVASALFPKKPYFLVDLEKNKKPITRKFLKWIGAIQLKDKKDADYEVWEDSIKKVLNKKKIIHMYPEQKSINYYSGLRDFNDNAFELSCKLQKPILPIVISWRKRVYFNRLVNKSKPCATITIGEPIYTNYVLLADEQKDYLKKKTIKQMNKLYEFSNSGMNV